MDSRRQVPIAIKVPPEIKEAYDGFSHEKKELVKLMLIALISGLDSVEVESFSIGTKRIEVVLEIGERFADALRGLGQNPSAERLRRRIKALIESLKEKEEVYLPAKEVARILQNVLDQTNH